MLQWIFSGEGTSQHHVNIRDTRKEGLGQWLLTAPEFLKWKNERSPPVLLGCGVGSFSYCNPFSGQSDNALSRDSRRWEDIFKVPNTISTPASFLIRRLIL